MTKLGWSILAIIVVGVLIFASMLSLGTTDGRRTPLVKLRREAASIAAPPTDPLADVPGRIQWQGPLLAIPVAGVSRAEIASSWGDPRDGGQRLHRGNDIMAPRGTPVVAAADGRIEKLFESGGGGGTTLYARSPDGRWSYYYAHLAGYAPGMREGRQIRAGDTIGYVGDTGNAGIGNYHLHFGLSYMAPGDDWHEGRPVDPTPLLAGAGAAR